MQLSLCSYVYDVVTDFEICGFHKNIKIFDLENKTLFFLQLKKFNNYTSRATLWQKNNFIAEMNFKIYTQPIFSNSLLNNTPPNLGF